MLSNLSNSNRFDSKHNIISLLLRGLEDVEATSKQKLDKYFYFNCDRNTSLFYPSLKINYSNSMIHSIYDMQGNNHYEPNDINSSMLHYFINFFNS